MKPSFSRTCLRATSALFLILFVTSPLAAAEISLTVIPQLEKAVIGQDMILQLDLTLPAGASMTAQDISVAVKSNNGDQFFDEPYPLKFISPADDASSPAAYSGKVQLEWVATVLTDAVPQTHDLQVDLTAGQHTGSWSGSMEVDFGKEWNADKITNFIERRGMFLFLLLIFGFGLLMSLSPCIYPMIPITLAVIGAQSKEKGILNGLIMSVTYVVGMALIYGIIGFVVAFAFSGLVAFLQSPVVMVPIALLLLVFSLSMFGAYTLQAPAWLQNRLGGPGGSNRSGLLGVFSMGMIAGLIASPCVGPFLGGLLTMFATTGNGLLAFISLFIFGMGMGVLLIGVGTFPALLTSMPQSGGWMETVNRGMGLILVAMAMYFLRPGSVLPANIFWPVLGVMTIVVAVFMGAFDKQDPMVSWWERTRKGLGLVAFLAGLYFLVGSFVQNGFLMASPWAGGLDQETHVSLLQPASGASETLSGSAAGKPAASTEMASQSAQPEALPPKVPWTIVKTGENLQAFFTETRAKAKAEGKPIMIDFWATWCVYCKKLDKKVWNQPEVVAESMRFVTIKVDATAPDDEEMTALKEEFKVPGLPRVIFIDSRGKILHGRTSAFKPAPEMLEIMKNIR